MAVVIDPPPIRCDEVLAATPYSSPAHHDAIGDALEAEGVEVVDSGTIRIAAEHGLWTIDLRRGRLHQAVASRTDVRHLAPGAWTPVVAIIVTPHQLTALTDTGTPISSNRAHRGRRQPRRSDR